MSIPVYIPLPSLTYTSPKRLSKELEDVLAAEINVKQIYWKEGVELTIILDTTMTNELWDEANKRKAHRQEMQKRKDLGLKPGDSMPKNNG